VLFIGDATTGTVICLRAAMAVVEVSQSNLSRAQVVSAFLEPGIHQASCSWFKGSDMIFMICESGGSQKLTLAK
jgi:hypothetical protein